MSKEVNQEEYAPRTIADVKEMLSKHSNGEIQRTIRNCELILQNDHVLANAIRLNLLSERIDIVKPVGWPRSGKALNDTDMKYILRRMEKYGMKIIIDRSLARWTNIPNKEFYFIMTCADDNRAAMACTLECFRGFTACLNGAKEKGVIYGTGVYRPGEVMSSPAMKEAYEMGKNV